MKNQLILMGLLSALSGLFACGNTNDKASPDEGETLETVNPNNILFTTPTLNNALPEFKEKTDSCAFFHEDEWRQIEFITKDQKALIDQEISKIKNIYDHHAQNGDGYIAFKNVAVRELITQPLRVDLVTLKAYLSDKPIKMQGLGMENNSGQVKGGFFFAVNGINYYGLMDNNLVTTFCIYSADSEKEILSATDDLAKLLEKEDLYLVDWRSMKVMDENTLKTDLVGQDE